MSAKRWLVALIVLAGIAAAAGASAASPKPIVVSDADALRSALAKAKPGTLVIAQPGTYDVSATLSVPDGVTLEGGGVMQGAVLPRGFQPGTETTIVALPELTGDVVTLGNGASLRRLSVADAEGRDGNAVGVLSRRIGDSVSASIVECEVVQPNFAAGNSDGPTGGGIEVFTRNLQGPAGPPPETDASLSLSLERSIVRTPNDGRAVFAINSASRARIALDLSHNVIAGTLDVAGGISRGDAVTDAAITLVSAGNLYAPPAESQNGWTITGGATPPFAFGGPGASHNHVRVDSTGDRIEGVPGGILASGARRFSANIGPSSDNAVELRLTGLTLSTMESDFVLAGARSESFDPAVKPEFGPGDRNTLTVLVRNSTGSGQRANVYANVLGPMQPMNFGTGNRLAFVGTPAEFAESNVGIVPPPPAKFFTARRNT